MDHVIAPRSLTDARKRSGRPAASAAGVIERDLELRCTPRPPTVRTFRICATCSDIVAAGKGPFGSRHR